MLQVNRFSKVCPYPPVAISMSKNYWLIVTIGIALVGPASAQQEKPQAPPPALEKARDQPPFDSAPVRVEAITAEIGRITRAIEAGPPKSAEEEQRATDDLRAQKEMALWAKWMFVASAFSVFLTAIGIWLIGRTLIYTRDAAAASKAMVKEGEHATSAALAAAREAGRQADLFEQSFKRLERPYVYIFGVHQIELDGHGHHVKYSIANYGRTPAEITILAAGMGTHPREPIDPLVTDYRDDPLHDILVRPVLPPDDVRKLMTLAPDGVRFKPPIQYEGVFSPTHDNIIPDLPKDEHFFVWIRVQYSGPFDDYLTNACWRYDRLTNRLVPWGDEEQYNGMR